MNVQRVDMILHALRMPGKSPDRLVDLMEAASEDEIRAVCAAEGQDFDALARAGERAARAAFAKVGIPWRGADQ